MEHPANYVALLCQNVTKQKETSVELDYNCVTEQEVLSYNVLFPSSPPRGCCFQFRSREFDGELPRSPKRASVCLLGSEIF